MTCIKRREPSSKTEYQVLVSVWKPLLLAHVHCESALTPLDAMGMLANLGVLVSQRAIPFGISGDRVKILNSSDLRLGPGESERNRQEVVRATHENQDMMI